MASAQHELCISVPILGRRSVYLVFKLDKFHLSLLCVWSKDVSKNKLSELLGLGLRADFFSELKTL